MKYGRTVHGYLWHIMRDNGRKACTSFGDIVEVVELRPTGDDGHPAAVCTCCDGKLRFKGSKARGRRARQEASTVYEPRHRLG